MATIQIETNLDVIKKQRALVKEALGKEGVYIRTKETLIDLLNAGALSNVEKGKIIATTLSNMTSQITSSTMSTALQWASREKELALEKLKAEKELDILIQNELKIKSEIKTDVATRDALQAKLLREYGKTTKDADGNIIGLSDEGLVFKQEQLVDKQIDQAQAVINKAADDLLTAVETRLSIKAQTSLYARQERGFDDNKYQKLFETQMNAWGVMFSSGMLGSVKPSIIEDKKVDQLYDQLVSGLPVV